MRLHSFHKCYLNLPNANPCRNRLHNLHTGLTPIETTTFLYKAADVIFPTYCHADGSNADVVNAFFDSAYISATAMPGMVSNISSALTTAFANTPQLLPATVAAGFSQAIADLIESDLTSTQGFGPGTPLGLALAHGCGQDAAITAGTRRVRLIVMLGHTWVPGSVIVMQQCATNQHDSLLNTQRCSAIAIQSPLHV